MNSNLKKAPRFYAKTTRGEMNFPDDFGGRWVVLYYYSGDFSPDAALDIMEFNKKVPKFKSYGADVIAMSTDSVGAHIAWALEMRNMDKDGKVIDIELVSDKRAEIAKAYGINENEKAVLIIDPDGNISSFHKHLHSTGLNVTETERELLALKTAKDSGKLTPAGWTPGESLVSPPPKTVSEAQSAIPDREAQGLMCVDWYICYDQGM